eukprot:gene7656-15668_t
MDLLLEGKINDSVMVFEEKLIWATSPLEAASVLCNIAVADFELDLLRKCIKTCQKALDKCPTYLRAYVLMGKAHEKLGKQDIASATWRKGLEYANNSCDVCILLELRNLLKMPKSPLKIDHFIHTTCNDTVISPPIPPSNELTSIETLDISTTAIIKPPINKSKSKESKIKIQQLHDKFITNSYEINPSILFQMRSNLSHACGEDIIDDLIGIGYLQVNTNKLDKAIEIFSILIEYRSDLLAAYLGIGSAYAMTGALDLAIQSFSKAIEIDPTIADAWKRRGQTRAAKNLYSDALVDFQRAIDLYPDGDIYLTRGLLYHKMKNFKRALIDFQHSRNFNDNNSSSSTTSSTSTSSSALLWNYIGLCQGQLGNIKESLEAYLECIRLDNSFKEGLLNYAQMLKEIGQWKESEEAFQIVINADIQRNFAQAYGFRAVLYHSLGDHKKAIEDLNNALLISNQLTGIIDIQNLFLMAISYQAIGKYSKSIEIFNNILSIDPSHHAASFKEISIILWSNLDNTTKSSNEMIVLDDIIHSRIKEACCKHIHVSNIEVEDNDCKISSTLNYEAQPIPTSISDVKYSEINRNKYIKLIEYSNKVNHFVQLRTPGFIPNKKQHRMFGIAVLQMAVSLKKHVQSIRNKINNFNSDDITSTSTSNDQLDRLNTNSNSEQKAVETSYSYREWVNIAVKWRQISEPNDTVWWIDKLTRNAFEEGFGLQTPLVNGQLKTIRYYSYFPKAFTVLKDLLINECSFYNATSRKEELSIQNKLKIVDAGSLEDLFQIVKKDFYVITPCHSLHTMSNNTDTSNTDTHIVLEGTRLTLVEHSPEGFEFTIRIAGTPHRWDLFDKELQKCFEKLIEAIIEQQDKEQILRRVLEVFYFWANFSPLSRGSALCGYAIVMAGMLAADLYICEPIPVGKQLDWEAILTPRSEDFISNVLPWFVIKSTSLLSELDVNVNDVENFDCLHTLRHMIEFLNLE